MSFRAVEASQPVEWLKSAFEIFKPNALMLIVMGLIMIIIMIVLALIPVIGPAISGVLAAFWYAGFQTAARAAETGTPVEVGHLFAGFQGDRLVPIATIGAVGGAVNLLVGLISLGGIALASIAALLSIPAGIAVFMVTYFAVPRTNFDRIDPIVAMKESLSAWVANIVPLIVLIVVSIAVALGGLLALIIGLLVAVPIIFLMSYYGYKDVFAVGAASAPMAPPPAPPAPPVG